MTDEGPPPGRVDVLGVQVDPLTVSAIVDRIARHAGDPASAAVYVVKPYVEMLELAVRDPAFRTLLNDAWLCVPDGVALQWAAAVRRNPPRSIVGLARGLFDIVRRPQSVSVVLPERVAGLNLTDPLLRRCRQDALLVHVVGSPKRQTADVVNKRLRRRYPGLRLSGSSPGDAAARDALLAQLLALRPDVVLVGMGFPRQERLIAWLAVRMEHGVLLGEGGSFDYREFGGGIRRAPEPVRRAGLEWLWRLIREPRRLRRQMAIPRFIWHVWQWSRREGRDPRRTEHPRGGS